MPITTKRAAAALPPKAGTRKDTRQSAASRGGQARAEALTPEQRAQIAREGAQATNSAEGLAARIRRKWPTLTARQRDEVVRALSGCNGLVSRLVKNGEPLP